MRHLRTKVILLATGAIIAGSGFALMATNTVLQTGAGSGAGVVSGYAINQISYSDSTLGAGCPAPPGNGTICQVSFQADAVNATEPPAGAAYAAFKDVNGNLLTAWEPCSESNGVQPGGVNGFSFTSWTCNFIPSQAPGPIASLDVRANQ